jgi:hypothetical protein
MHVPSQRECKKSILEEKIAFESYSRRTRKLDLGSVDVSAIEANIIKTIPDNTDYIKALGFINAARDLFKIVLEAANEAAEMTDSFGGYLYGSLVAVAGSPEVSQAVASLKVGLARFLKRATVGTDTDYMALQLGLVIVAFGQISSVSQRLLNLAKEATAFQKQ